MSAPRPGFQRAGSSIASANKTIVLVSGGESGIGLEVVKALASLRSDFQVLLGCKDVTSGESAAASIGALINVNPINLDITDDKSIDHAFKAIEQHFGRLDVLINAENTNGQDLLQGDTRPSPRDVLLHVYNVNVIGTGVLTDRMIPLLQHSKAPKVIFTSDELGSIGKIVSKGEVEKPELMPYSSSKAAVNMMTVHYAMLYPDIKINACAPAQTGADAQDASIGAQSVLKLATEVGGATGTFTNGEAAIPW